MSALGRKPTFACKKLRPFYPQ